MKNKIGIVFVHGIVGNNRIFDFLVPLLPEDCLVKYVVLDGHGGDALAFSRTSMAVWRRQVAEAVMEIAGVCNKVIGVGHSMGCLLLLENEVRSRVAGLYLLNPPLRIRLRIGLLTNAIKVASGLTEGDPVALAAKDAYGVSMDFNPLHYYGWPARYMELFAEIRRIRRSIFRGVSCPVRVVLAEKDEMVSVSSKEILQGNGDVNVVLLPESRHYYYSPKDMEAICEVFTQFWKYIGNSSFVSRYEPHAKARRSRALMPY